jgi:hypothetical protein
VPYTHNLIYGWAALNEQPISATVATTADGESNRILTVPPVTNLLDDYAVAAAKLRSLYILATPCDVTLLTNSLTAPDDTLTVPGGTAFVYQAGANGTNPFHADVARIYVRNLSTQAVQVHIRSLFDL